MKDLPKDGLRAKCPCFCERIDRDGAYLIRCKSLITKKYEAMLFLDGQGECAKGFEERGLRDAYYENVCCSIYGHVHNECDMQKIL